MGDIKDSTTHSTKQIPTVENISNDASSRSLLSPGRKRGQSDLRSAAMLCHTQISKELWGKKHANSFVDHVRPSEVEAFALDISLRAFWELNRENDPDSQCSLSLEGTTLLRQITLDVLQEHQKNLTQEYSFEIPDPEIVKQREQEKQEQLDASRELRKQRAEAAKKERMERSARMKAKRMATVGDVKKAAKEKSDDIKTVSPASNTSTEAVETSEKPEKIVQKSKIIISSPNRLKATGDRSFSMPRGSSFTSEKKSFKIQPPPKQTNSSDLKKDSIAAFAASRGSLLTKDTKSFKIAPPARKIASSPTETLTVASSNKNTSAANAIAAFAAGQKKKKEKTFTRPPLSKVPEEDVPIPNITIKQTLVNTEQLVQYLFKAVQENFASLCQTSGSDAPLDFYHYSVKGPRPANEDEYTVIEHVNEYLGLDKDLDRYAFFGAYDGHSGKYTSLFVRSQIHHKVCTHPSFPDDMQKAINEGILEIDGIVNQVQERDEFACGSTALAAWVRNNEELIVGNVGDCRGFICRGGKPVEIADPHHPTRPDEKERIEALGGAVVKRGAWRVNGILAVSRSIGDFNMKKFVIADPEVKRFTLQPEDEFVVIASDGLWDVLNPEEMIQIVRDTCSTKGRKFVCQTLCEAALDKQSKDNITVLSMFLNKTDENEKKSSN